MQHYYKELEPGIPPAPIIPIVIITPDWQDKEFQVEIEAFLDTGSDCTLVPLSLISKLQLTVNRSTAIIQGIGGDAGQSIAVFVNLKLGNSLIKAVRVYGYSGDILNEQIIIGRDVLNQCCVEFDGIAETVTFKKIQP